MAFRGFYLNIMCTFAQYKTNKQTKPIMGNSRVVAELPANLVREIKSIAALEGKTFKALLMEMINVKLESVKQVKNA